VSMRCGKMPEWLSLSPCMVRRIGTVFAVMGALLIVVFVPIRYWMALIGLILLLSGLAIRIFL